jgi:ubiquinone/menaquinone biosynthesis C-methylase UbiE
MKYFNMNKSRYICPETHQVLYEHKNDTGGLLSLFSKSGKFFPVKEGLIDLTYPEILDKADQKAFDFYEGRADDYDKYLSLTFKTHNEDELACRKSFIDKLDLKGGERVLEVACGTGRDSALIAERLGKDGHLFCQDISPDMMKRCIERLNDNDLKKEFALSNAVHLPFADNYFDAFYSFGALGEFSNIKQSLSEMVRVTKPGGKIVVGDESMPPWLRSTQFAKILSHTNPQFEAKLPLKHLPVEARNVNISYVIGGVFYLIDFVVGEGEPTANMDFEIPGERGGSYLTRYEGQLEGVSPEVKHLAYKALKGKNLSMHKWLDEVVKKAALKDLQKTKKTELIGEPNGQ